MSKETTSIEEKTKADNPIKAKPSTLVEGKHALFSCESIVFCIDVSGSMSQSRKIETLKKCFRKYIERKLMSPTAEKDRIGVVAFPGDEEVVIDPVYTDQDQWDSLVTDDDTEFGGAKKFKANRFRHSYRCGIKQVFPLGPSVPIMCEEVDRLIAGGGTPMGHALIRAGKMLNDGAIGLARIVIMSDGEPNEGLNESSLLAKAKQLYDQDGIVTDTVAICMGGSYVDKEFMKRLAKAGGGQYTEINVYDDFERYLNATESERKDLLGTGTLLLPGASS